MRELTNKECNQTTGSFSCENFNKYGPFVLMGASLTAAYGVLTYMYPAVGAVTTAALAGLVYKYSPDSKEQQSSAPRNR